MQIEYYKEHDEEGNPIEDKENWKNVVIDMSKIAVKKFSDIKDMPFSSIRDFFIFNDGLEGYLNAYSELPYFSYCFFKKNKFYPNMYRFEDFNVNIFIKNLFKYFDVPINSYAKVSYQGNEKSKLTSMIICFTPTFYMYVDGADKGIFYYDPEYEKNKNSLFYIILGLLKKVKKPKVSKNKIFIIYQGAHGFDKIGFDVKKIDVNLSENYNDGFEEVAGKITDGLNDKNKTNLVILSGEPGVGKCVSANTKITIRNKKTGKIEEINIVDLM